MVPGDVPISGSKAGFQETPSSSTALPPPPPSLDMTWAKGSRGAQAGWMNTYGRWGWGGEPEVILCCPSVLLGGWAGSMAPILW